MPADEGTILAINPGSTSTKFAVYAGGDELQALAEGALRMLQGEEQTHEL